MTTPRVTVPVEPEYTATDYLRLIAEGWEVIESTGSQMTIQNPEDDGPQDLVIDVDAMLSAAPAPEGGAAESTGAKAVIRNGQIVISIDVDALPLILSGSIALNAVAGTFKVTDAATFAKEVCYALNAEKEDGTTRVHMMFDSAFDHAIDQGAEGVEEISEDEFESEAARLQAEAKAALATREEAPAEAGVADHLRVGAAYWRGEASANQVVSAIEKQAKKQVALRAQPPAREDAKDCYDCATDRPHRMAEAYTRPPARSLRVVVEALEAITDLSVNLRHGGPDSMDLHGLHEALNTAVDVAHEALDALQAEQGAK